MKSEAIKKLETLAFEALRAKYPNTPLQYLPCERFNDKTANQLTKSIIAWLKLNGHFAQRVNTVGLPVDKRKTFTDVLGNTRQIGRIEWRKSNTELGASDIVANINSKFVAIEIKMKDRQSEHQKNYQQKIEASGGTYILIRSFEEFYNWYQNENPGGKPGQIG